MKHWRETTEIVQRVLALAAAGRHAALATVIRIEGSSYRRPGAKFLIEDDGIGFHPEAVVPGSGLFNIRERIHALGGVVSVASAPGRGTVISGSIPDSGAPS